MAHLLHEDSTFSNRKLIVILWTIIICTMYVACFVADLLQYPLIAGTEAMVYKPPPGAVEITYMVWGAYFVRRIADNIQIGSKPTAPPPPPDV